MKKTRHTEEQIAFALKQAETGTSVAEVSIDITLPSGVHLAVDSFVNEKALARVLRALEHGA